MSKGIIPYLLLCFVTQNLFYESWAQGETLNKDKWILGKTDSDGAANLTLDL